MVWALPQPDRSSVHEFSVFADKPVVLIRESLFDAATSLNNVSALCPQFANELCESFAVIPSAALAPRDPAPLFLDIQRSFRSGWLNSTLSQIFGWRPFPKKKPRRCLRGR